MNYSGDKVRWAGHETSRGLPFDLLISTAAVELSDFGAMRSLLQRRTTADATHGEARAFACQERAEDNMRIGILGSGLMGGKLGTLFVHAGHEVVFSYARTKGKLDRLARKAGGSARAGTPAEAAAGANAVLLAVHWLRLEDVLRQAGDLTGQVILTCSLPMNAENTELAIGHSSSGAEELAKRVPRAQVVGVFHTVPSEVLFSVYEARRRRSRPSLVYCGDDKKSKGLAARLIRDVGFDPLDAGPLRSARYTEPFALLVAQLAYEGSKGPKVAYRFDWWRRGR
jgi:8-hydroxy-5-deazaflavin:NADPH oxidoreductase